VIRRLSRFIDAVRDELLDHVYLRQRYLGTREQNAWLERNLREAEAERDRAQRERDAAWEKLRTMGPELATVRAKLASAQAELAEAVWKLRDKETA